ncbi:hypothetical protein [Persicitalea sp.]|uniref:capsular polysaccharide export protein, LipB/KpsS family n=1 Tax=Persicitalea sp. TaxID=3100273 RepID=UPI003592F207
MKFLILINSAPDYQPFFCDIGNRLLAEGHEVVYAIESKLGDFEYLEHKVSTPYVFSEYLLKNPGTPELPKAYRELNVWETMFSDFDRNENFDVNRSRTAEWYTRITNSLFCFFEKIQVENGIDLVIYENVSNSFSHVAFEVFKAHGVPYLGWASSRFPGRYESNMTVRSLSEVVSAIYDKLVDGRFVPSRETMEWVTRYYENFMEVPPDYMVNNPLNLQNPFTMYLKSTKLRTVYRRFRYVLSEPSDTYPYHLGNPLVFSYKQFTRSLTRFFKTKLIGKHFKKPDFSVPYILYPLHFHPESSTSVWAKNYVDEYTVIKNIAFNMPAGHLLYLKDHKSAFGYPSLDFYRSISALPNVVLLRPDTPTKLLIEKSRAVITITGTVGFESLVLGKRVIVLGSIFYDFHPRCRKMTHWDELFDLLSEAVNDSSESPLSERMNLIVAYYEATRPGRLLIGGENTAELMASLALEAIEVGEAHKLVQS